MLTIGKLSIENPVALAPMAGATERVFRAIARRMGAGMVITEMVSSRGLLYGSERTKDLLAFSQEERPLGIQLFGSDPEEMGKAARVAARWQPDLIDINMGCPTPKIVKNGDGAALMLEPDKGARIVEAVVKNSFCPVTVKLRRGWDKDSPPAETIAPLLVKAGAQGLAVHGRYRDQFYRGKADWECIARVKANVDVPVWGNGDVDSPEAALLLRQTTNCDGVMIGRAALGNPWLFHRINQYVLRGVLLPEPSLAERAKLAVEHLKGVIDYKGEYLGVRSMRPQLAWYTKGFPNAARLRRRINQAGTFEEIVSLMKNSLELPVL
ncbi:MAG: tRNA dihydrouridine synthase DusB [Firmicutes bacterium]|nr:tRNA dihydrouridine synthase DusB [Bacillota bacterium]